MEKMSHKSDLALMREQQLAKLRESTNSPERFVAEFACAKHDRAFRVTFARTSPAKRFRCESIDKSAPGPGAMLERLKGLFSATEALRIRTDDVDISSVSCAWCAAPPQWTLCGECRTLVCGAGRSGSSFTCRASCGAQSQAGGKLESLDAARQGGAPEKPLIGQSSRLLLGKGSRK
jgi:hypothetical protein